MKRLPAALDWAALPLYYLLALIFTWPLAANPTLSILGDGKDGWMEAWNLWWLDRALETGANPFRFETVFAPGGVTNYLHALNPLQGALTLPLQWLAGAPFAYNVASWSAIALTAFGGYLLGRDVSGSRAGGFLAGLVVGFAPHQFAQLLSHLSVASIQFLVLGVWCLFRALGASGWSATAWSSWAGACLAASALSHLYTFVFQILAYALLGLVWAMLHHTSLRQVLAKAALSIAIGLLVVSPLLLAVAGQAGQPDAPGQGEGTQDEISTYSADLVGHAIPSPFHPVWGESSRQALRPLQGTLIEKVVFPGYVALAIALFGIIAPSTRKKAWPWIALGVVGLALSLGPSLHVGGDDTGLWLPGQLFYALPFSSLLRAPARFTTLFLVGLGVCAALGVSALLNARHRLKLAPWGVGLATGFALFEGVSAPFPTSSWAVDPWYAQQAANARSGGVVLEVPFDQYDTRPLASQMASGLPLAGGYLSRMPVYPLSRGVQPFTSLGLNRVPGGPLADPNEPRVCRSDTAGSELDLLRLAGVRYVALHHDRLEAGDPRPGFINNLFPSGADYTSGDLSVFQVGNGHIPGDLLGAVEDSRDWGPLEEGRYRWTGQQVARIHVWSGGEREVQVTLQLTSFGMERAVRVLSDGEEVSSGSLVPGQLATLFFPLSVPKGFSTITLIADGGPVSPQSLGMGDDARELTMSLQECFIGSAP